MFPRTPPSSGGFSFHFVADTHPGALILKQIKRLKSIMFDATLWLAVSSAWRRGTTNQNNPRTELQ